MAKIRNALWAVPLLWLIVAVTPVYSDFIYLKNGSVIECDSVWEGMGDYIWVRISGGDIGYPISNVNLKATFGEAIGESIARRHGLEEALIRELMRLSGLDKQLSEMGAISLANLKEGEEQEMLPSHLYNLLISIVKEAYNVEKIRQHILEQVEKKLDSACIQDVLNWLRSPAGRRITRLEEAATTPEGVRQMRAFAKQLQTNPPSQARVQLAKRLDEATNATELLLEMATVSFQEIVKLTDASMPKGQLILLSITPINYIEEASTLLSKERQADHDRLSQQMKTKRQKMREEYQNTTLVTFLYTYQDLTDDELETYLAFVESENGRRYHQTILQALKEIQIEIASYIGRALNKAFAG